MWLQFLLYKGLELSQIPVSMPCTWCQEEHNPPCSSWCCFQWPCVERIPACLVLPGEAELKCQPPQQEASPVNPCQGWAAQAEIQHEGSEDILLSSILAKFKGSSSSSTWSHVVLWRPCSVVHFRALTLPQRPTESSQSRLLEPLLESFKCYPNINLAEFYSENTKNPKQTQNYNHKIFLCNIFKILFIPRSSSL